MTELNTIYIKLEENKTAPAMPPPDELCKRRCNGRRYATRYRIWKLRRTPVGRKILDEKKEARRKRFEESKRRNSSICCIQ